MGLAVQQALHGYSDGHRLISSSLQLPSAEARIMLVMSDLSGPGVRPGPTGYLTGYPLEGVGKYVLARTWSAPEMPRPGCVWTHSLVIDFADLASMKTAEGLLQAFQRPWDRPNSAAYGEPVDVMDASVEPYEAEPTRIRTIINALYTVADRAVIAEAGLPDEDDGLTVAIWMQQWPRLRRAFGFCTLAGIDRSSKGVGLDLQLVPTGDRQIRSKFPDATNAAETPFNPILDILVDDLRGREHTQVREFLRRTGGDVEGGRRAMLPLCRLHASLFLTQPPELSGAVAALADLDELGSRQARSVRVLVARQAVEALDEVDDTVFDFLIETLEQAGLSETPTLGPTLVDALWRRWPSRFISELNQGGPLGQICAEVLAAMPVGQILTGLRRAPELVNPVVRARPDLLEDTTFWQVPRVTEDLVFDADISAASVIAGALAAAGRAGSATDYLVERADPGDLIATLEAKATDPETLAIWLAALARQTNKAAAALASGRATHLATLVTLARFTEPDSVPNDYGTDPWILAVRTASGSVTDVDLDFLTFFLMSRALGHRSRSPAELMRFTYGRVYRALEESRIASSIEGMVTWRLDWAAWFQWDNCARLRLTVTRKFVDQHLDPETFGRLADEGPLALALFDEAARSGKGRRYLADVRKKLAHSADRGLRVRADYIAKKLN
jgi:hypothetical protein